MKNAIILHSSHNNSKGNWIPWLKKELEKRNQKIWTPDLPNAEYPDVDKWVDYIFSNKEWQFDKESVIIGHSAGATAILGLLQKLRKEIKIDKAILVAGLVKLTTLPKINKIAKGLLKKPFDYKKIKNSSKNFYFIHSDNDRYQCDIKQGKIMQKKLGGKLIVRPGEDHFNLETSPKYKKLPLLLEILEER